MLTAISTCAAIKLGKTQCKGKSPALCGASCPQALSITTRPWTLLRRPQKPPSNTTLIFPLFPLPKSSVALYHAAKPIN